MLRSPGEYELTLLPIIDPISQLGALPDGISGFSFISVEPQVKGLASPPDPWQTPSVPSLVSSHGSQFPSPEPVTALP